MGNSFNLQDVFDTAIYLTQIQIAARDLFSKGLTVTQLEEAILSSGIPILPEVHLVLVNTEREAHTLTVDREE
jgi:hypothetical protein